MRQADVAVSRIGAGRLGGPLRYLAGWLVAGLVVAGLAVAVLGRGGEPSGRVAVPPVREIALTPAASKAGCEVADRRPQHVGADRPRPAGGIYEAPITARLRERAVRRGLIVIEYRHDVADGSLETLNALQQAVPAGTILAPSWTQRRSALVATAFRRRLSCTRVNPATFDALLLFRGRYLGSAPPS